ncbi:MAG TPA: anhydro-N-acetylmuramic acid kinase, partial [Trebonia sp.]
MRVLGMISGTSHDGIDVAVVDFTMDGAALAGRIEYCDSVPYDPQLRGRIIAALPPARPGFEVACELDTSIGQAFAAAAVDALGALGAGRPDLICSHGQTVFHWVTDGHARGTL